MDVRLGGMLGSPTGFPFPFGRPKLRRRISELLRPNRRPGSHASGFDFGNSRFRGGATTPCFSGNRYRGDAILLRLDVWRWGEESRSGPLLGPACGDGDDARLRSARDLSRNPPGNRYRRRPKWREHRGRCWRADRHRRIRSLGPGGRFASMEAAASTASAPGRATDTPRFLKFDGIQP